MSATGKDVTDYEIHGVGIDSITKGFDSIGMNSGRRSLARKLVEEVLAANQATELRWYRTPGTPELKCVWDEHDQNVMFIIESAVSVIIDPPLVTLPERSTNWAKEDGKYKGWSLGATSGGRAGNTLESQVPKVLCPTMFVEVIPGKECPFCGERHTE